MYKFRLVLLMFVMGISFRSLAQLNNDAPKVKIANGVIEGISDSGVKVFKGVPFAAPPVGQFRWREPQPVKNWE